MLTEEEKRIIEMQFDAFCKAVLKYKLKSLQRQMYREQARLLFVEDFSDFPLTPTYEDTYNLEKSMLFEVHGQEIAVNDPVLGGALKTLLPKYRDIILLNYFRDMNGTEISKYLGVPVSTVNNRRRVGLAMLRERISTSESLN